MCSTEQLFTASRSRNLSTTHLPLHQLQPARLQQVADGWHLQEGLHVTRAYVQEMAAEAKSLVPLWGTGKGGKAGANWQGAEGWKSNRGKHTRTVNVTWRPRAGCHAAANAAPHLHVSFQQHRKLLQVARLLQVVQGAHDNDRLFCFDERLLHNLHLGSISSKPVEDCIAQALGH